MATTGTAHARKSAGGAGIGRLVNIGVGALFLTRERMEHLFSEWEHEGALRFHELEKRILRRPGTVKKSTNGRHGRGNGAKKKTMMLSRRDIERERVRM